MMKNFSKTVWIDQSYSYTIESCYDSDEYVWTLNFDGFALADGYESTVKDAERKALMSHRDQEEYLAS